MLHALEVERVLHCGDIGSVEVAEMFRPWPTDFVTGNCDYNGEALREAIEAAGQKFHGRFGDLEITGRKVALLHSDDGRRFQETIGSGAWDMICYGHTHVASIDRHGDSLVLNPGAIYRASPRSIAVVEMPSLEATIVEL